MDVAATYDDQDRILTHGGATYAQNLNGDLTTKTVGNDVTSFLYDAYGNLKQVGLPNGWRIEYTVDGRNRRVARRVYDDQDTLQDERRWLWQGQLRIVAELDGDGELVKRFVYGTKVNVPEYMVTYDPVSHLETGTYRILTDQLGSPRLVVDVSAGTVVQRMRHDEWGNVLEGVGSGFTPFGFAGGLYDPATGLVRFGARDYDPETGRWTGKDPIHFEGGDSSLYSYSLSEPVNIVDPNGLTCIFGAGSTWLRPLGSALLSDSPKGLRLRPRGRLAPKERPLEPLERLRPTPNPVRPTNDPVPQPHGMQPKEPWWWLLLRLATSEESPFKIPSPPNPPPGRGPINFPGLPLGGSGAGGEGATTVELEDGEGVI